MRPCDCHDMHTAMTELREQGVSFNSSDSIEIVPPNVILICGNCTIRIPQHIFKRYAKWYLEDQERDDRIK